MSIGVNDTIAQHIGQAAMHSDNGVRGARGSGGGSSSSSWFEAMSRAWGQTMDQQASRITDLSDAVGDGSDNPSGLIALTSASMRMQFLSNSASTSMNSISSAQEALARKS